MRPSAEVVQEIRKNIKSYPPEIAELLEWYEWLSQAYRRALETEARYREWMRLEEEVAC